GDPVYFHGFHIPRKPKAPGPDGVNIWFRSGGIINESGKRSTLDFLETQPRKKVTNARRRDSRIHPSSALFNWKQDYNELILTTRGVAPQFFQVLEFEFV